MRRRSGAAITLFTRHLCLLILFSTQPSPPVIFDAFRLKSLNASHFFQKCTLPFRSLAVTANAPETFEGPFGDGDHLCMNSTVPFLTVAFQSTRLLKVRYFS
jgi:hypothetical protein